MTIINTDKHDYELIQDWGKLPEDWTFGVVSAVATGSQNRVYVYQRKDPGQQRHQPAPRLLYRG